MSLTLNQVKEEINRLELQKRSLINDLNFYEKSLKVSFEYISEDFRENLNKRKTSYQENFLREAEEIKNSLDYLYKKRDILKSLRGQIFSNLIIYNTKGEILLLKRCSTAKIKPNEWCLPGGHVEDNETTLFGAVRETKEETNLTLLDVNLINEVHLYLTEDNKEIWYYSSNSDNFSGDIKLNEKEHCEFKWCNLEEIESMDLIFDLKDQLKEMLNQNSLFNSLKETIFTPAKNLVEAALTNTESNFIKYEKEFELLVLKDNLTEEEKERKNLLFYALKGMK